MSSFALDFGDSGGEALGDGMDSGAIDLSGSAAFDDFSSEPLQGSSIDLAGSGLDSGVNDASWSDGFDLSGVTETAPSDLWDSGEWDTNGAGSAASTHVSSSGSAENISGLFSGVAKFGASIGQLFARGSASTQPVMGGIPQNVNPNRTVTNGISSSHAFLLIGVVILIGGVIAMGGKHVG